MRTHCLNISHRLQQGRREEAPPVSRPGSGRKKGGKGLLPFSFSPTLLRCPTPFLSLHLPPGGSLRKGGGKKETSTRTCSVFPSYLLSARVRREKSGEIGVTTLDSAPGLARRTMGSKKKKKEEAYPRQRPYALTPPTWTKEEKKKKKSRPRFQHLHQPFLAQAGEGQGKRGKKSFNSLLFLNFSRSESKGKKRGPGHRSPSFHLTPASGETRLRKKRRPITLHLSGVCRGNHLGFSGKRGVGKGRAGQRRACRHHLGHHPVPNGKRKKKGRSSRPAGRQRHPQMGKREGERKNSGRPPPPPTCNPNLDYAGGLQRRGKRRNLSNAMIKL